MDDPEAWVTPYQRPRGGVIYRRRRPKKAHDCQPLNNAAPVPEPGEFWRCTCGKLWAIEIGPLGLKTVARRATRRERLRCFLELGMETK